MTIGGVKMVTDRSLADVNYAKELIKKGVSSMIADGTIGQFISGLKGAYNYTDINRVESAVGYLDNALVDADYEIWGTADFLGIAYDSFFSVPYDPTEYGNIVSKTDWSQKDLFSATQRERYLSNISHIVKSLFGEPLDLPQTLDGLNYEGANSIENYLVLVNDKLESLLREKIKLLENTADGWMFSGEIYGGEI